MRISYNNIPAKGCGPDAVRNNPVIGKISASDYISRPGSGYSTVPLLKKGPLVAMGHQLGTGLAVGIGIITVQRIALPVAVFPLPVFVHLIRRHVQKRAEAVCQTRAL